MLEKTRRAAHGLAGVVQNVVEPRQPFGQESREYFDARRMPQIEPMDLQAPAKLRKIGFFRVAAGCVDRKTRGHDDMRTGTQELEGCLKADLDPGTGDQRIVAIEIGCLPALGVIEVAADIAQGIIVAMHLREGLLADVAGAVLLERQAIVSEITGVE